MFKKIIHSCFRALEHHPEHTTMVHIWGKDFKCCSRCLGMSMFAVISFFAFGLLHLSGFHYDFWFIFLFSIGLVGFAFADWSSVEMFRLREGSDTTRIITGGALGIAVSMHIWLLPSTLLFRIITLLLFNLCFTSVIFLNSCRKNQIHPVKVLRKMIENVRNHSLYEKQTFALLPAGCLAILASPLLIPCVLFVCSCGSCCCNNVVGGDAGGGCCNCRGARPEDMKGMTDSLREVGKGLGKM